MDANVMSDTVANVDSVKVKRHTQGLLSLAPDTHTHTYVR